MRVREAKFVLLVFVLMILLWAVGVLFVDQAQASCRGVACGIPFPEPERRLCSWRSVVGKKDLENPSCNPAPDWFNINNPLCWHHDNENCTKGSGIKYPENCLPEGWHCSFDGSECWPPEAHPVVPEDKGDMVCPDPDNPDFCYREGGKK